MRLRKQKREKDKEQRKGANSEKERGGRDGNCGSGRETNKEKCAERRFRNKCAEDASMAAKRAPTLALALARCTSVGTGSVIESVGGDVDAEENADELEKLGKDEFRRTCFYCNREINDINTWNAGKKHNTKVQQAETRKRNENLFRKSA